MTLNLNGYSWQKIAQHCATNSSLFHQSVFTEVP